MAWKEILRELVSGGFADPVALLLLQTGYNAMADGGGGSAAVPAREAFRNLSQLGFSDSYKSVQDVIEEAATDADYYYEVLTRYTEALSGLGYTCLDVHAQRVHLEAGGEGVSSLADEDSSGSGIRRLPEVFEISWREHELLGVQLYAEVQEVWNSWVDSHTPSNSQLYRQQLLILLPSFRAAVFLGVDLAEAASDRLTSVNGCVVDPILGKEDYSDRASGLLGLLEDGGGAREVVDWLLFGEKTV